MNKQAANAIYSAVALRLILGERHPLAVLSLLEADWRRLDGGELVFTRRPDMKAIEQFCKELQFRCWN